jgi:hypothetical protein
MAGGGLMQLVAYGGAMDIYICNKYSNLCIVSYEYNLLKNICNDNNDYDNYEFSNIKFCDWTNANDNNILLIKNFSNKYSDIAINCSNQNLKKIFIYDKNIKYFNCSLNKIGLIDISNSNIIFLIIEDSMRFDFNQVKLPRGLVYLDCSTNGIRKINFTKLKNLKYLICRKNYIKNINNIQLPKKIRYLDLSDCGIESFYISSTINKIEYLMIKNNSLESMDLSNLSKLKYLDISSNPKLNFNPGNLPSGLKVLLCSNTNSSDFYNLPMGLEKLDCSFNNISNMDYLPESIIWLDCSNTQVSNLSNLPIGLKHINYNNTIFSQEIENNNYYYFNILPKKTSIFICETENY